MASNQLEKKNYLKTSLRAYFLQNDFNCDDYQDLGYADMLYPSLHKMYKDDDDKLQEALKRNIEFFNTSIHFLPFITNLHLVTPESRTPSSEIRDVKMTLMGPLVEIDDSLVQFCLAPLLATIGASLAMGGLVMGPIPFLVVMNIILLIVEVLTGTWGYKLGIDIITTLSSEMEQISGVVNMIGATVISGLVINFVKITTPIQYMANIPGDQQKTMAIQNTIDTIVPRPLPVLFTELTSYLTKVKKWTMYKPVILTTVIGVVLSLLHIVA